MAQDYKNADGSIVISTEIETENIKLQLENLKKSLTDWGSETGLIVENSFTKISKTLLDSTKKMGTDVLNAFKEIGTGVKNFLTSDFKSTGVSAVTEFVEGLRSKANTTSSGMENFVTQNIINPVKNALDIHSPSGVFEEIGVQITEGLSKGVSKNSSKVTSEIKEQVSGIVDEIKSYVEEGEELYGEYTKLIASLEKENISNIKDIEEEYTSAIDRLSESFDKSISSLWSNYHKNQASARDEYMRGVDALEREIEKRASSIGLFGGVFGKEVEITTPSTSEMIENLLSSTSAAEAFQQNLNQLLDKNLPSALVAELESLGPSALGEMEAINAMTDNELKTYLDLWMKRLTIGKEVAEKQYFEERNQLVNQYALKIKSIYEQNEAELKALIDGFNHEKNTLRLEQDRAIQEEKIRYQSALQEARSEYQKETTALLLEVRAFSNSIGEEITGGIKRGMLSAYPDLINTASTIARDIENVMKDALKIQSPSRVFEEIGLNTVAGLTKGLMGGEDSMEGIISSWAKAMTGPFNHLNGISSEHTMIQNLKSQKELSIELKGNVNVDRYTLGQIMMEVMDERKVAYGY